MSNDPAIRVAVDPANPGQFFACCGLLELADRLWPGAEGHFTDGEFRIACGGDLYTALCVLVMDPPEEVTKTAFGLTIAPLIAPLRFSFDGGATTALTLDAWVTVRLDKGVAAAVANPPWNFWSGQQTSNRIWSGLRETLAKQLRRIEPDQYAGLFGMRVVQGGRFGFDPGPAWNARDTGFSPNDQSMQVESSAAVELLAAVGVQRFRPIMGRNRESFEYAIWTTPLPPCVAAMAACGAVPDPLAKRYRGRVVGRASYAALGHSSLIPKGDSP